MTALVRGTDQQVRDEIKAFFEKGSYEDNQKTLAGILDTVAIDYDSEWARVMSLTVRNTRVKLTSGPDLPVILSKGMYTPLDESEITEKVEKILTILSSIKYLPNQKLRIQISNEIAEEAMKCTSETWFRVLMCLGKRYEYVDLVLLYPNLGGWLQVEKASAKAKSVHIRVYSYLVK